MASRVRVNWDSAIESGAPAFSHAYSDITDYIEALHWRVGSLGDVPTASLGGIDLDNYEREWVAGQGRLSDAEFLGVHSVEITVAGRPLVRCWGRFTKRSLSGTEDVMRMELFNPSQASLQRSVLVNRVTQTPQALTAERYRDELGITTEVAPSNVLLLPGALWYQGSEANFLANVAQLHGGLWCDNGSGRFTFFRWSNFFVNDNNTLTVRALVDKDQMTIQGEPVWVPTTTWLYNTQVLQSVRVLQPSPPIVEDPDDNTKFVIGNGSDGMQGEVLDSGDLSFIAADVANARANPTTGGVIVSLDRKPTYSSRAFAVAGDLLGIVAGSPVNISGDDPFSILNSSGMDAVAAGDVSVSSDIDNFQVAPEDERYVRSRYVLPRRAGVYTYYWRGTTVRAVERPLAHTIARRTSSAAADTIEDSVDIWGVRRRPVPPWVTNRAGVIERMREDLQILSKPFELAVVDCEIDEQSILQLAGVGVGTIIGVNIDGYPYAALVAMMELRHARTKIPVLRLHCIRPVSEYVAARFLPPSSVVPEPPQLPEPPVIELEEEKPDDPNEDDDPVPEDRRRRDIPLDGLGRPFKHGRSTVLCPTPGTVNRPIPQRKFFDVTCHQMLFGDDDGTDILLPVEADSGSLPWRQHSGSTLLDRIYAEQPGMFIRAKREWPGDASNDIYVAPDGTVRFSSDAARSPWLGQAAISMSRWMRVGREGDWSKDAWGRVPGTNGLPFTREHWRTSRWGQGEGGEDFIAQPHLNIIPTRAFTGLRQGTGGSFDRMFQNNRSLFAVTDTLAQGLTMLLMHDGGREYLRVGGAVATGTRSEWTSDITTHRSSGGDAGERPYKSSRILDFAFVPTYPAPFDIQVYGNWLTGNKASLTIRFNDTPTLGDYGNLRAFRMSGQYFDGRWIDGATGDKRLALANQKIADRVSFDVVGWRLSGGCNDDPVSSTGDVQLMDMEEEVLLNRLTLDLREDDGGKTIFERAAALPTPVFRTTGQTISTFVLRPGASTAAQAAIRATQAARAAASSLGRAGQWTLSNPFSALRGAGELFKFGFSGGAQAAATAHAGVWGGFGSVVAGGAISTAVAVTTVVVGQIVISGLVTNWMIGEIGDALAEQSIQWQGRSARMEIDFPRPGTWVVGLRVTDPDNIAEETKKRIDATEFCTRYKGNTVAQTAAYVVWPSAFR